MKKLMTLITAVALGGFAWAVESGEEQQETSSKFENSSYTIPAGYEEGTNLIVGVTDDGTANIFTQTTPLVQWWASNFPTNNTVEDMANYEQPAEVALATIGGVEKKYLKIEADTAAPMLRTLGPAAATKVNPNDNESTLYSVKYPKYDIGDLGIFVDANVSLSASEEPPQDFDGKIAVWLQVIPAEEATEENPDGFAGSTNLMVTCGALNDDFKVANTPTNIVISAEGVTVNPDEWHRITIRSIKEIKEGETVPGFVIYVDGKLATADDDYSLPSGLTDTAAVKFNNLHALFPSASKDETTAQTLDSVGFSGNGGLSKIDLTDMANAPIFAQDPTHVMLTWDEHVIGVTIDGVALTSAEITQRQYYYLVTNFNVAVDVALTLQQDPLYKIKEITHSSVDGFLVDIDEEDDKLFTFTPQQKFNASQTIDIATVEAREAASLVINWADGRTEDKGIAPHLKNVFATIKGMTAEDPDNPGEGELGYEDEVVITLYEDETEADFGFDDTIAPKVILDLNGHTMSTTVGSTIQYVINSYTVLTIRDTSKNGGGKLVAAADGQKLINNKLMLTLTAVADGADKIKYDGVIENDHTSGELVGITILDGLFTDKVVDEVDETLVVLGTDDEPLVWSEDPSEGYYSLEPKGATVKVVDNDGVDYVLTINEEEVDSPALIHMDDEIEVVATLKEHYAFTDVAAATAADWVFTENDTVATYSCTVDNVDSGITITAPETAQYEYAISVDEDIVNGSVVIDGEPAPEYVEVGDPVTLTVTPDPGYAIETVKTNGTPIEAGQDGYSFEMPADDVVVSATFTEVKVDTVALNKTELELVEGGSEKLTATVEPATALDPSIAWTTSADGVATVAADGTVTAVAEGTATITATNAASGKFATCTVTVTAGSYITINDDTTQISSLADLTTALAALSGEVTININGSFDLPANYAWNGGNTAITKVNVVGAMEDRGSIFNTTAQVTISGLTGGLTFQNLTFKTPCAGKDINYQGGTIVFDDCYIEGAFRGGNTPHFEILDSIVDVKGGYENCFLIEVGNAYWYAYNTTFKGGTKTQLNMQYVDARFEDCVIDGTAMTQNDGRALIQYCNSAGGWHEGCSFIGGEGMSSCAVADYGSDGNADYNVLFYGCEFNAYLKSVLGAQVSTGFKFANLYGLANTIPEGVAVGEGNYKSATEMVTWPTHYSIENLPEALTTYTGWWQTGKKVAKVVDTVVNYFDNADDMTNGDIFYVLPGKTITPPTGYDLVAVTTDSAISYKLEIQKFTVTFDPNNGGENIVSNDVPYGTAFTDVAPKDLVKAGYELTGWTPEGAEVTEDAAYTAVWTPAQLTVTITLNGAAAPAGWTPAETDTVTTNFTVETETFTLPELTKADSDFAGYVKAGETATNKTVTITKGEVTASVSYEACFTAKGPDVPVDDPTALDDKGKENAAEVAAEIAKGGTDVNTWVAKVYGEGGKIPASKLNATTPANIALAVANDLPITVAKPTFEVSASTVTAESGNVAAFEFTLMDGTTPEQIKAITAKVKAMVKYTSNLATVPFDQATDAQVDIKASPVNGKIKAELKKTAANAGFMKVEPNQPAVGEL